MSEDDSIFECARVIRSRLSDILGLGADALTTIDRQLAEQLARAPRPEVAQAIITVLQQEPSLQVWAAHFLEHGSPGRELTRDGYKRLPGAGLAVPAVRYACPEGDFVFYRAFPDDLVPICPTHKQTLVIEDRAQC